MSLILTGASGQPAEVETNHRAVRVTLRPTDVGSQGAFKVSMLSGSMNAGLAATSPIAAFRNPGQNIALIRRVFLQANSLGTGFTAGGAAFSLYIARNWTADDSGGTALSPGAGRMRSSHANQTASGLRVAASGALTAGARTLDANPVANILTGVGTSTYTSFVQRTTPIFQAYPGEWPLVLGNNEGFVLLATVPATGVWQFDLGVEWDEVNTFGTALAV